MKTPFAMAAPKSFAQPHPVRNLGSFAHPPAKSAHRVVKAPKPANAGYFTADGSPNYQPKVAPKQNKRFDIAVPANKQSMDMSDAKSEYQAPAMNAQFAGDKSPNPNQKGKKLPKPKSGLDYFGKL